MVSMLIRMFCCVTVLVLCRMADAESMSEVFGGLVQEEKASRAPEKPIEEMTDAEVVVHAGVQVQDTVNAIGIGVLSAIEKSAGKLVKQTANLIRGREAAKGGVTDQKTKTQASESSVPVGDISNSNAARVVQEASASDADAKTQDGGGFVVSVVVLALIGAIVIYGISYARVKAGEMVVYASWGDFVAASAWVVLALVGYGCDYASANGETGLATVATILKILSCVSALWLVGGAFMNRGVANILLAIPARIIVAMLVLFAWAKLKESLEGLRSDKRGLVDGVLIPFAIAMFVFNVLVQPMVGDRRG